MTSECFSSHASLQPIAYIWLEMTLIEKSEDVFGSPITNSRVSFLFLCSYPKFQNDETKVSVSSGVRPFAYSRIKDIAFSGQDIP